jgi:hypothetical protein
VGAGVGEQGGEAGDRHRQVRTKDERRPTTDESAPAPFRWRRGV